MPHLSKNECKGDGPDVGHNGDYNAAGKQRNDAASIKSRRTEGGEARWYRPCTRSTTHITTTVHRCMQTDGFNGADSRTHQQWRCPAPPSQR
jgi:hypothetical protein